MKKKKSQYLHDDLGILKKPEAILRAPASAGYAIPNFTNQATKTSEPFSFNLKQPLLDPTEVLKVLEEKYPTRRTSGFARYLTEANQNFRKERVGRKDERLATYLKS